jgi:hypothetical protein
MSNWDDEAGYDRDDLKHPDRAGALLDRADDQRKRDRENGIPNPLVEAWRNEQRAMAAEVGRCEYGAGTGTRCICPVGHAGGHYSIQGRE